MRMACAAILAAGLALPGAAAQVVTEDNFSVHTTADLVALCSAEADEPMAVEAVHFCYGFIVGAVRLQQTTQAASNRTRHFCLPAQMPKRSDAIAAYLGGKYPCGKRT